MVEYFLPLSIVGEMSTRQYKLHKEGGGGGREESFQQETKFTKYFGDEIAGMLNALEEGV